MFTLSAFCQLMASPQIMTGLFRDILQRHFASPDFIGESDLRKLIWRSGEQTNILIETAYRWRPELTQLRPGIIIKRNSYRNVRLGVGDALQTPFVDQAGNRHFATSWLGSHTLFCITNSGAQTELLCSEVQRELTGFAEIIRGTLDLLRFQVLEIGPVSILEEAQENFAAPVTVTYAYVDKWSVRPQVPRLNNISLSLLIE